MSLIQIWLTSVLIKGAVLTGKKLEKTSTKSNVTRREKEIGAQVKLENLKKLGKEKVDQSKSNVEICWFSIRRLRRKENEAHRKPQNSKK
jgi:hypothetical protein